METQLNEALKHTSRVYYWSMKWIMWHDGKIKNKYAYEFLKEIKENFGNLKMKGV